MWIGGIMDAGGLERWKGMLPGWSYTRLAALCELRGADIMDWTVGPYRLRLSEGMTWCKRND